MKFNLSTSNFKNSDTSETGKLLKKVFLFFLVFSAVNHLFYFGIWKPLYGKEASFKELEEVQAGFKNNTGIFYLGDSTLTAGPKGEKNKSSIGQILQDISGRKITVISHAGYSLDLFEEFVKFILKNSKKISPYPVTLIIPINLRSFSVSWEKQPMYQFLPEKQKLSGSWNYFFLHRPLAIFKYSFFGGISEKEFLDSTVMLGDIPYGKVRDFHQNETRQMKDIIIYHYLNNIGREDRKVKAIDHIIDLAHAHKVKLLLYFTPIDYQTGNEFLPTSFESIVGKNIELIKNMAKRKGVSILDLSHSLESKSFYWKADLYPNEHLNFEGRQLVARGILGRLKILGMETKRELF